MKLIVPVNSTIDQTKERMPSNKKKLTKTSNQDIRLINQNVNLVLPACLASGTNSRRVCFYFWNLIICVIQLNEKKDYWRVFILDKPVIQSVQILKKICGYFHWYFFVILSFFCVFFVCFAFVLTLLTVLWLEEVKRWWVDWRGAGASFLPDLTALGFGSGPRSVSSTSSLSATTIPTWTSTNKMASQ